MADAYLPVTVHHLPWHVALGVDGRLLPSVAHYVGQGVVRVIAGPTECHVVVDVQRPYWRPRRGLPVPAEEFTSATTAGVVP